METIPKKPKVSVITICFNEEKNIKNTCESIVSQTFKDYEWVVVDGGSTDGTKDILKIYQKNITSFISEKDNGIQDAMNKGIKMAKGEWVIFMNGGDCFYQNNSLEKIFSCNYDVDIIFSDGTNNVYNTKHPLPIDKKGKIKLYKFFCDNSLCHQATFIRRDLFKKVGFYDTSYKIIADHVFNYLAIKDFKSTYKYIPETTALIDLGGVSTTDRSTLTAELLRLRKEKYNFFIEMRVKGYEILTFFKKLLKKYA